MTDSQLGIVGTTVVAILHAAGSVVCQIIRAWRTPANPPPRLPLPPTKPPIP